MNTDQTDTNLIDGDLVCREKGPPYALFAKWRAEDPVHWNPAPTNYNNPNPQFKVELGFWVLTKYNHVVDASTKPDLYSVAIGGAQIWDVYDEELERQRAGIMGMDPPGHTQIKRMVVTPFMPRNLSAFEPEITRFVKMLVDSVALKGHCEFVFDVASRLPVYTFCVLMGIPEEDHERIFTIGNAIADFENPADMPAYFQELFVYAQKLAKQKRLHPDDSIMSIYANGEVDGEKLTPEQINGFFMTVAVAGHETTRNTAVHFIRLMNEFPDQYALLRTDLDRYLKGAIDETLRFAPPVMNFRRTATRDFTLEGKAIKAGDKVYLAYGAANRDPDMFPDPDRFDITRVNASKHLSFGMGPHVCLGARLAMMQLEILMREIIGRIPDIHPLEAPHYINSILFHGLRTMPVAFTPEKIG